MKRASVLILTCISLLNFSRDALAAKHPNKEENGFLVDANVMFQRLGRDIQTQAKVILSSDSNKWTTLVDDKAGVSVFARKVTSDAETVLVEFMAMDITNIPAKEISSVRIRSLIGEKAQISSQIEDGSENFTVESKVVKVRYHTN